MHTVSQFSLFLSVAARSVATWWLARRSLSLSSFSRSLSLNRYSIRSIGWLASTVVAAAVDWWLAQRRGGHEATVMARHWRSGSWRSGSHLTVRLSPNFGGHPPPRLCLLLVNQPEHHAELAVVLVGDRSTHYRRGRCTCFRTARCDLACFPRYACWRRRVAVGCPLYPPAT